jgi:hypothetical protein
VLEPTDPARKIPRRAEPSCAGRPVRLYDSRPCRAMWAADTALAVKRLALTCPVCRSVDVGQHLYEDGPVLWMVCRQCAHVWVQAPLSAGQRQSPGVA